MNKATKISIQTDQNFHIYKKTDLITERQYVEKKTTPT